MNLGSIFISKNIDVVLSARRDFDIIYIRIYFKCKDYLCCQIRGVFIKTKGASFSLSFNLLLL